MRVRHSKQPEAGYVLIAVAGMLVVLVGFTALAIDTGIWFGARTQAQRAADTAALAGAFTFINTPKAIQPATAQNHAIQAAVNNKVMGTAITAAQVGTPDVTLPDPNTGVAGKVTVTIRVSELPTFFAKIFGVTGVTEVHASAQAGKGATNAELKPYFMPHSTFAPRKPSQAVASLRG